MIILILRLDLAMRNYTASRGPEGNVTKSNIESNEQHSTSTKVLLHDTFENKYVIKTTFIKNKKSKIPT